MTDTAAPRLTEAVAGYALGHLGALDDQVTELVKRTLIDTLGVALAARQEPPVQILAVTLGALPAGRSTIWATGETTDAPTAALLNGTAGHALDFDDVTDVVYGHPSVVLWPAIFAAAEQEGSDGRSVVEAFVVGFGVQVAIASAMDVRTHYGAGWHSTATIGIIGAAAAVSRLMGLDEQQTRHAIGLAASMAGGSRQNFGTMTKPLHPGLAARDAVFAARLAANGFTADVDQLDSAPRLLLHVLAGCRRRRCPSPSCPARTNLLTAGINVKKYPFLLQHPPHRGRHARPSASRGDRSGRRAVRARRAGARRLRPADPPPAADRAGGQVQRRVRHRRGPARRQGQPRPASPTRRWSARRRRR